MAQPGSAGGTVASGESQSSLRQDHQVALPTQNPESSSESSDNEDQNHRTQYQTAMDTVVNNPVALDNPANQPSISQYNTVPHQMQDTTRYIQLEQQDQPGLGRLSAVIRELFGRDTI